MKTNRKISVGAGLLLLAGAMIITTHTTDALNPKNLSKVDSTASLIKEVSISNPKGTKEDLVKDINKKPIINDLNSEIIDNSAINSGRNDDGVYSGEASNNTGITYSEEFQAAYNRAYQNGIISDSSINNANLYNALTNLELADIMNKFAENVLGRTPDTSKSCSAYSGESLTDQEWNIAQKSCQLGLIDISSSQRMDYTNRAILGTALSRALWGNTYDGGYPYYANHLQAIKAIGIMTQINNPENTMEIKGYVLLMLMRTAEYSNSHNDGRTNSCDINGDGKVDIADYVEIADAMASNTYVQKLDLNGDGKIDNSDLIILFNCLETGNSFSGSSITNQTGVIRCDVNKDGKIDIADYVTILNAMASNIYRKQLDINGDGKVDIADSVSILNCMAIGETDDIPAGLVNNLTKTVEFKSNETTRKVVFDGTYKALGDISIAGISITNKNGKEEKPCYNDMTLSLSIDGDVLGSVFMNSCTKTTSIPLLKHPNLKKGEYIDIKIKGELNSGYSFKDDIYNAKLTLYITGLGASEMSTFGGYMPTADFAPIKILKSDSENSFTLQSKNSKDTVYLKGSNQTIAEFMIKPSTGNNEYLNELVLEIDKPGLNKSDDIRLIIDGNECDLVSGNDGYNLKITCQPDTEISSKGAQVKVVLKNELEYDDYTIGTKIKSINGESINKSFSKRFVSALVYIKKQENKGNYTEFTIGVDKYDDNYSIETLYMLTGSTGAGTSILGEYSDNGPFEDGYTFTVSNTNSVQPINYISYVIKNSERVGWADSISIKREDYPDYFKVNREERKIYANNTTTHNGSRSGNSRQSNTDKQNSYTSEMVEAYQFAYENGLTTANSIDKANLSGNMTRGAMAKMLSYYAINVLGQTPDLSMGMPANVSQKTNEEYNNGIVLAYQLRIMGQNSQNFRPYAPITKAHFVTALSRMLYGTEDGNPYYKTHMTKLYNEGILDNTQNPNGGISRRAVLEMLYKSSLTVE